MSNTASVASSMHTFAFNGNRISFQQGKALMVNATQMARPFNKRPAKWLELPSTNEFIRTITAIRKSDRSSMISVINGVGTWFHEDVALEFARWLSPEFAIWCNDRIKELLTQGMTSINPANYVPVSRYNQLREMYDFQVEQVRWWTDMYGRQTKIIANLVDQMMKRKAKQLQAPTWMTVVGYATFHNISCGLNVAARLGRKAADLCARQGIVPDTIPDPRFGRVNTYPLHILEEVFNAI